jgi:oligopeptide transport system substrate-binding protein
MRFWRIQQGSLAAGVVAFGVFVSSTLVSISFNHALAAPSNDPKTTFTFRLSGEPATMDWNRANTPIETYLMVNLMEGLVGMDDSLKPVPALAQSWKISDDGKTYTFKLRPDLQWSDGVVVKAKDFVYSWKRLLQPITAAPYAYLLFDIEGAEEFNRGTLQDFSKVGVTAIDDLTLQVRLKHPIAYWIYIPTFWVTYPLREDIVAKYGSRWDTPGRMVTVGPFTLESHDLESKIVLRANPKYYGPHGNIERAVGLIVKDDSTAVTLFESGRLDFMTDIPSLDLQRLAGKPELKTFPYIKTGYLAFVVSKFPASNVRLRRAIAMAIDKSRIGVLLHGGQTAATSFVPPKLLGYSKSLGLEYNPTAAKKELEKAGLDATRPVEVDMILANWEKNLSLSQFIQAQLKKALGITVNLQPFDHKTFRAQLELKVYASYLNSWSGDYPDPDNFVSVFLGGAGNNRTTWKNPKYDEWVVSARSEQNPKLREKKYIEAQKILLEQDAVVIPLFYEPNIALIRSRVKGLELNPLNYLLLKKVTLQ